MLLTALPPAEILAAGEAWWVQNVGSTALWAWCRLELSVFTGRWEKAPATSEGNVKAGKSSKPRLSQEELNCASQTHVLVLL